MGVIHIGRQCYKDKETIVHIVSLDHTQDKTFLRVAQEKGKVESLFGRQHRTAVIMIDGQIILTSFSAKSIFAHVQNDML